MCSIRPILLSIPKKLGIILFYFIFGGHLRCQIVINFSRGWLMNYLDTWNIVDLSRKPNKEKDTSSSFSVSSFSEKFILQKTYILIPSEAFALNVSEGIKSKVIFLTIMLWVCLKIRIIPSPASSSFTPSPTVWKSITIWHLRCPPKIKHYVAQCQKCYCNERKFIIQKVL